MNCRVCRRILATVLLLSFWRIPAFGGPRTAPPPISSESETKFYSEYEVDTLIEDLTGAAVEAIEQAAAEAARAAALASLEREASLVQAQAAAIRDAQRLQGENGRLKQSRVKTAVVTGAICFFGGLAVGAGGIALLQGGR